MYTQKAILTVVFLLFLAALPLAASEETEIYVKDFSFEKEAELLMESAASLPLQRRIAFLSRYFLGRKYHPETKKRIKKQRAKKVDKKEAVNTEALPVKTLRTSLQYLDCMTYVEHILALASAAEKADYRRAFLPALVDIMFHSDGKALMNHHRNHFTSRWAEQNEKKGYLRDVAKAHPASRCREVWLNRVGDNRTFYIEDSFMISRKKTKIHYFPKEALLAGIAPLESGDMLAMVCDKEGLDVLHMGFYIISRGQEKLRHASYGLNKIVDEDFRTYVKKAGYLKGLMVMRPVLRAKPVSSYVFRSRQGR